MDDSEARWLHIIVYRRVTKDRMRGMSVVVRRPKDVMEGRRHSLYGFVVLESSSHNPRMLSCSYALRECVQKSRRNEAERRARRAREATTETPCSMDKDRVGVAWGGRGDATVIVEETIQTREKLNQQSTGRLTYLLSLFLSSSLSLPSCEDTSALSSPTFFIIVTILPALLSRISYIFLSSRTALEYRIYKYHILNANIKFKHLYIKAEGWFPARHGTQDASKTGNYSYRKWMSRLARVLPTLSVLSLAL
ncbi:hypothetical protein BDN70DRAFT_974989 [Pholiota conissans]|uniref:Uncharacterized protein n=1 Tax=Pholiota conissans TaxID=109636 RepID=A0A9P6CTL9_9AGAR|nr:hypothetical protein BDN70DRAFT_974989 [Pholiota conissans]